TATNDVRGLEAELARGEDRLRSTRARADQASQEVAELEAQLERFTRERDELSEKLRELEEAEASEADVALAAQERLLELRDEEAQASRALDELKSRTAAASAKVAAADAKLSGFTRRLSEIQARREKQTLELDAQRGAREELDVRRTTLAEQLVELREGKKLSAEEKLKLEEELKTVREGLVLAERELDTAKNELSQRRNRLRALEDLAKRLEGVGAGTKHLLQSGDPAVLGMVGTLVEAPKALTAALAGLLGDRLQDVVVTDLARGREILASMAEAKRGRAAIVPLSPPRVVAAWPRLEGEGLVGRLVDQLGFADEHAALVRSLVGGALVVERAEHAGAWLARAEGAPVVALDGTVSFADGRVVGGAGDAVAAGMIEQHREIRELFDVVAVLGDEVTKKIELHQALRNRAAELGAALDRARAEAHESELAVVTTEKDLRRAEDQLANVHTRVESLAQELADLEDRLAEAADEEATARADLDDGQAELSAVEGEVGDAEAVRDGWSERASAQQGIVTDQKIRLARMREQAEGTRAGASRLSRSIDELALRSRRLDEELLELAARFGATAGTLFVARDGLGDAVAVAQAADLALEGARQRFDVARHELAERESGLKDLRKRSGELAERRSHHDKEVSRLAIELSHLLEGVAERFRGLDLRRIVGDYHARAMVDDTHRARIGELGQLLDRMGPVNLDAVKEHEEAETRFNFYTTQKADLDGALADLVRAIEQMDRETKKLFKDTFDSVNEKFQAIFPRMFRGGVGKLQLTNPDDLLETGVEILAQPPGKKLGNIELMSGGEKALTAVSLIFAMFQHKPSPFCILDEVDAPLDEANVTRYNEAIRSMTDKSQFILITHIKRTMQSVDVLYGVTMQEPGVSKLVSVKVNETAEKRVRATDQSVAVA
ncbi:MAG: chromosome segregation protein SMC, partial [Polyangiaceae bacterium]|nr:chromosome segregation protein SMC [Polyangiaceae bacterium]